LTKDGGLSTALGSWEDFISKWGFNEGASTEGRDYEARALIVAELNEMTGVKAAKIRAVEYDRPGLHNSCLILILPNPQDNSDADQLSAWKTSELEQVELPVSVSELVNEIIAEAYDSPPSTSESPSQS
jgi:hypothetical protein